MSPVAPQPRDDDFEAMTDRLKSHFSAYRAADIILSLGVSALWLPNRSSQVKHTLATMVLLCMSLDEFQGVKSVTSFNEFAEFHDKLRKLLPQMSMLEDFVPEADWGEIRVSGSTGFEPIFYGGSVERIPDFIEAFRLLAADSPQALADMNVAIAMQRHLIENIPQSVAGSADSIRPGHMETPSAEFWALCSQALSSAHAAVTPLMHETSDWIIAAPGALDLPVSMSVFSNIVMMETAVPPLFVRTSDQVLPVALRGATSAVLDRWSEHVQARNGAELLAFGRRLGGFLSKRFRPWNVFAGPIHVISDSEHFNRRFAAVLRSGRRFHFFLPIDATDVQRLDQFEHRLKTVVDESKRWGLALEDEKQVLELRDADGNLMRSGNVDLVAVLAQASTTPSVFALPECGARLLVLPDFVSLFDSLKDSDELEKFWAYLEGSTPLSHGFVGLVDHFAAFRDCHALLVPGALTPDAVYIDPHWNSSWRFKELKKFWSDAPKRFPDDLCTWKVGPAESGPTCLKAKSSLVLAWSGEVGACTVQATMEIDEFEPNLDEGPLLELFVHCVIDALTQRKAILIELPPFQRQQVVLRCEMNQRLLPMHDDHAETTRRAAYPLLDFWKIVGPDDGAKLEVAIQVNISRLRSRLDNAMDASFEAECAAEVAVGLCTLSRTTCDEDLLERINATANVRPRFTMRTMQRTTDVPDYASPHVPDPEQFKLARKELAIIFKDLSTTAPTRYELKQAKEIMNAARDEMRKRLHGRIASYDRDQLLKACVQEHDQLTAHYQHEVKRLQLSLNHEVSFDRAQRLAELYEQFTGMARNYRYLLECCISLQEHGENQPMTEEVVQLIASIDWLSVLYGASDTLHNDIDVGGIELDDSFVPTVFFSEDRDTKEQTYLRETANAKLGVGLREEDEVNDRNAEKNLDRLNAALVADLGCSLTTIAQVLEVVTRWHTAGGGGELRFRYSAAPAAIVSKVREHFPDASADQVAVAIAFLTLSPSGVRQLSRKTETEPDVPVWEHFKRVHRYLIRPLVPLLNGEVTWGAATTERTRSIWLGAIYDGYLPADFPWPRVTQVVEDIKRTIEKQLEVRAHEICSRYTAYASQGIDFRRRFSQERFEDVGDFDVLAYWPDRNLWLAVECKYNQPPFCLKDARRLRDRIFGNESDRAQFAKIERRLQFLHNHSDRLRSLLSWPTPSGMGPPKIRAAYVSREIYWSLLYPPYPVATAFVRVDALDSWLGDLLAPTQIVDERRN